MEIINPLNDSSWDDLLESHPAGSFFHTSHWARVLQGSYRYTPKYFTILANGNLQALVPVMDIDSVLTGRRGVSLPFSDYSDPFAADEAQYRGLVEQVLRYGKGVKWRSLEIRGGVCPWPENKTSSRFFIHHLNLDRTEDELFSRMRTNMQRNVKKASKMGVKVTFLNSMEAVDAFYRLNCITRKEHGIPPQPREFFRKIHEHVLSRGLGTVALASYRDRFVAGCVYFHFGKKAIYKYGASDEEGKMCRANNLVMWEAIRTYRQKGYSELCFGRTESVNSGLRDYKLGYGTDESILPYYKYEILRHRVVERNHGGPGFATKTWQRVPIPLSRAVGNILYRHIG
ncbi:MAG: hypothetical protein Kow00128_11950 [Deltaproteobacteria bacterium]